MIGVGAIMRSNMRATNASRVVAIGVLTCFGCAAEPPAERLVPDGEADIGERLVQVYGCGACHTIPGLSDATIGPPLTDWAERRYIAGSLVNTPSSLILWLRDPGAVEPGTAMPDLGLTLEEARHVAAFLYTLGDRDRYAPTDPMPATPANEGEEGG